MSLDDLIGSIGNLMLNEYSPSCIVLHPRMYKILMDETQWILIEEGVKDFSSGI